MAVAFQAAGTRAQSAAAATLTPALPSGVTRGLLLAIATSKNNGVHTTATAGWSKLGQWNSGTGYTLSLFTAAAGAAAPVITWAGSVACGAQCYHFDDPANPVDLAPVLGAVSTGAANPHTSAGIAATRADSLALYIDAAAANAGLTNPAGWTSNVNIGSSTDSGRFSLGSRPLANVGDLSGPISVAGATAAWVQLQLELRIAAPAAGAQAAKLEAGALLRQPNGAGVAKLEAAALLSPPRGANVAALEFGVLLRPQPAALLPASTFGDFAFGASVRAGRVRAGRAATGFYFTAFAAAAKSTPLRTAATILLTASARAGARRPVRAAAAFAFGATVHAEGTDSGKAGALTAEVKAKPLLVADLTQPILLASDLEATPLLVAALGTGVRLAATFRARPVLTASLTRLRVRVKQQLDPRYVFARQNEPLDALIWRTRGLAAGAVEAVLAANPGLAALGTHLPEGTPVFIPDLAVATRDIALPLIQLWD